VAFGERVQEKEVLEDHQSGREAAAQENGFWPDLTDLLELRG
jgi:hypothetical protein